MHLDFYGNVYLYPEGVLRGLRVIETISNLSYSFAITSTIRSQYAWHVRAINIINERCAQITDLPNTRLQTKQLFSVACHVECPCFWILVHGDRTTTKKEKDLFLTCRS